ncbi:hypothetical protein BX616_011034 [Lobosporangium transversale]|uniref:Uncharacterized protein n=1 Tax=Lobosporangium transversale TaxID=64571 RepID=A0A1Y2H022_9FUNG|nr:hypothetical protein BCR41DRAFT_392335 [Lobosporangium transversale]KAF9909846.1 hypothetical protein BX616_011034 [Lobosporangium transversale]ORZ27876.1 hypothetical protein BCR41DRAFT_392335 [Lobosporangium transversale]|eukprot:XP_021885579.1 hypothetical protein BCR41DRAFT_392335 [Lobosporangium transversale]
MIRFRFECIRNHSSSICSNQLGALRTAKEKYLALKIVSQALHWLENDVFTAPLPGHVFVRAWSDVFNTLFAHSGLGGIPGELSSKASRESRFLTESAFSHKMATSTNPKKADMVIRIFVNKPWADKICIFECKPEASDLVRHVQRESVRLNTAILLTLEEKALTSHNGTLLLQKLAYHTSPPITLHSTFTPVVWPSSASTPQTTSSPGSMFDAVAPVSPTPTAVPPPQKSTAPPLRKRDLPFVVFSPSKSQ